MGKVLDFFRGGKSKKPTRFDIVLQVNERKVALYEDILSKIIHNFGEFSQADSDRTKTRLCAFAGATLKKDLSGLKELIGIETHFVEDVLSAHPEEKATCDRAKEGLFKEELAIAEIIKLSSVFFDVQKLSELKKEHHEVIQDRYSTIVKKLGELKKLANQNNRWMSLLVSEIMKAQAKNHQDYQFGRAA